MTVLAVLLLIMGLAPAAQSTPQAHSGFALPTTVELIPVDNTVFSWGRGGFVGPLQIISTDDGLGLVETQQLDSYLTGLREVPATWPDAALEAQAVAARTFLAWSMARGRSGDARTYGYDICATTACQVYRGSAIAQQEAAAPWVRAVAATSGEVLLYHGSPAHTFYSSSAGRRTRPVQDVWGGSGTPYLVAVDSPEAGVTPYPEWVVDVSAEALWRILDAAGEEVGSRIEGVTTDIPPEGSGLSYVVVATDAGTRQIAATRFRAILNRYGPELYPGLLPARRPDGRRWPQAILSYTFEAHWQPGDAAIDERLVRLLPPSDRPRGGRVQVIGEGWGHGVGMSQWGAKAMSDSGASYEEILGHYYGGLQPVVGDLDSTVHIGLAANEATLTIEAGGPFELLLDGASIGLVSAGSWTFIKAVSGVAVIAPENLSRRAGPQLYRREWPR